jgi:Tfp pilus assembly protein PilO
MNGRPDRRVLAEVVVILAVCVGGWMMMVEPSARALRETEAEIEAARANPILSSRDMIVRMASRMSGVREEVRAVEEKSALGRDSSKMYGLVMQTAKAHGVTVHRLDPGGAHGARGTSPKVGAADAATFDMRLAGSYEAIASFLSAIEEMNGFVRPRSLRLTPSGDEAHPLVDAEFTFEAMSFTIPPSLASLMTTHVDP